MLRNPSVIVPEETVRRRYERGLRNFFHLYHPLATTWRIYDNSDIRRLRLIASGRGPVVTEVAAPSTWLRIKKE